MLGAIVGDVVGSVREGAPPASRSFPLLIARSCFTDDTVLTIAIADAILRGQDYGAELRFWGRRYPNAGYGAMFAHWLRHDHAESYGSFGNGAAMRVAPVGWAFDDLERVLAEAERTARPTHDHEEGIRGAKAIAGAVFVARTEGAEGVRPFLEGRMGYAIPEDLARVPRGFDITCQGTVPAAAAAFLCSAGVEDAVRAAVSLGGDTDTLACIAGALAEAAFGGVPRAIRERVLVRLDAPLAEVGQAFVQRYAVPLPD